jgi:GNAT superfamily N-acetyltransferase
MSEAPPVVRDLSPQRDTASLVRGRLDAHFADALGCDAALLYRHAVSIVPTELRRTPGWGGWVLPLLGVAVAGAGSCVISCPPELEAPLRAAIADASGGAQTFDGPWLTKVRAVAAGIQGAEWSWRTIFVADRSTFRQHGVDPSIRVERLEPAEHPDLWLSRAFDGPCFLVRDSSGAIASWAGITQRSDAAWEVAAVTEPAYRGRGLATVLTARATAHILESGRLALWVAEIDNDASRRLVERLGFWVYGEQIAASLFDPAQARTED